MRSADPGADFDTWRKTARELLAARVPPEAVIWETGSLFPECAPGTLSETEIPVPTEFISLARVVCCHCDPQRWEILYRILWRLTHGKQRHLLEIASDPDIALAGRMAKSVRREIHKMHAFVRFKLVATDKENGRERFAAWFEPDHWIVRAASPFFKARFSNMDWSIFTPKGCAHWIDGTLSFSEGIAANPIENPDALEAAWRTYYRSIFNPARLKEKMMRSEMPERYWKNLPEAAEIRELITASRKRTDGMLAAAPGKERKAPLLPYLERLRALDEEPVTEIPVHLPLPLLRKTAAHCRACPLWERATCTVFGEGPEDARIVIIGEQPGDREDIAGKPFIGPAGKFLDAALGEAGIARTEAYVTNAVKHFKWIPHGKTRLHQRPALAEIDACRPWLLGELSNIRPETIILLGATAVRAALGETLPLRENRGVFVAPQLAETVIISVHPSHLLRLPEREREEEYRKFVGDLRLARK